MVNSINTNIAAYFAQSNISIASNNTSSSVARLSSGNRIVKSSDDVAALSAGTSLRSNVTTLRSALLNASQGSSLLQVADGALSQITDILQRQKAIAVQAGSGSLDASARSFLDLEFQNLTQEIDRIASQTNFNGVKLLSGALSERANLTSSSAQATQANGAITLSKNLINNQTLIINGVTLTGKTGTPSANSLEFKIGATTADTLANLASKLNNAQTDAGFTSAQKLSIGEASYDSKGGNTLFVTARSGGALGDKFTVKTGSTIFTLNNQPGQINLLDVGFASATSSVTAATSAAATPFQNTNTITASIGNGPTLTLATLATNDTLTGIVTKINGQTTTTGISANLVYDTASAKYNIRLNYNGTGDISLSGGANFYDVTASDAVNKINVAPVSAGVGANYGETTVNLLSTGFSSNTDTVVTSSTTAAATPFKVGESLKATVGNGTQQTLYTFVAGDKLTNIVNGINARTSTTGISAALTYDSASAKYNIRLTSNDAVGAIGLDAGTSFYSTSTTSGTSATTLPTNTLNTATGKFNLFTSAFADNATVVVAANTGAQTSTLQFVAGNDITATLANGSRITLAASIASGLSVGGLADAINTSADSIANGITATATSGQITLSYRDSTQSKILTVNGGANFYNTGATAATNKLNNAYSDLNVFTAGFTAGASVTDVSANQTAAIPFRNGDSIVITVPGANSGTAITVASTVATNDTLTLIAGKINSDTVIQAQGIHAYVVTTGGKDYLHISYANSLGSVQANNQITFNGGTNFVSSNLISAPSATTYNTTAHAAIYTDKATHQIVYGLKNGADDGLGIGAVSASGSVGNDVLTGLAQSKPKVTISFPDIADADLTSTSNFGAAGGVYLTVGGHTFTFTSTASTAKASDEITIGSTLAETLDNAVSTINSYVGKGSENYELNQLTVSRSGNQLVFEGKALADVKTITGGTTTIAINNFNGISASNSGLLTANVGGVNTTNVTNTDFIGTQNAFSAAYKSSNTVDLSIKVGKYTYTATSVSTNPTSNTTVRLYSDTLADGTNGGYFDIVQQANKGSTVANGDDASAYARRLQSAFTTLNFYQERNVSSYTGGNTVVVTNGVITGSLVGSKVSLQDKSFANTTVDSISVSAPSSGGGSGKISITVNGEVFESSASLGSSLGANQTYRLTSTTDSNKFLEFTTGASSIDFSSSDKALSFEKALKTAFGATAGSAALSFQVGTTSNDKLAVSISKVTTPELFAGATLDVKTQDNAATAATAIDIAINAVTAVRANVGALQSRFNFASANIDSSIQNQDAARGTLLDTDIASESTAYATNQVKLQAGISVLAQANQQLQSLLKLIG